MRLQCNGTNKELGPEGLLEALELEGAPYVLHGPSTRNPPQ